MKGSLLPIFRAAVLTLIVLACNMIPAYSAVIKIKVQDADGKPAEGAKVFLYQSANVRKPADFISGQTGKDGRIEMTVPAGKYQAVARLKKDVFFGPLMPGDKHSGEPVEIECTEDSGAEIVFVVADIREVGQKKRTDSAGLVKIRGRLIDAEGKPVSGAYAFAFKSGEIDYIPEYISTWSDESGGYSLFVPSGGRYSVGSTRQFPPPPAKSTAFTELELKPGNLEVATDIQLIVY